MLNRFCTRRLIKPTDRVTLTNDDLVSEVFLQFHNGQQLQHCAMESYHWLFDSWHQVQCMDMDQTYETNYRWKLTSFSTTKEKDDALFANTNKQDLLHNDLKGRKPAVTWSWLVHCFCEANQTSGDICITCLTSVWGRFINMKWVVLSLIGSGRTRWKKCGY